MFKHIKEHALISSGTVLKALILGLFTVLFSFAGMANAATLTVDAACVDIEPDAICDVADTYQTLEQAIAASNNGDTINLTADITGITARIVIDKDVTLNGGGFNIGFTDAINTLPYTTRHGILVGANGVTITDLSVTMTPSAGWQGVYGIQAYNVTGVVINNYTGTGADAALLVNGSVVTLTGSAVVSGNEFGGVEADGTGATLDVSGATFANSSEAYGLPTIWEDGTDGLVTGFATGFTEITKIRVAGDQLQYYLVPANSIDPTPVLTTINVVSFPVAGVTSIEVGSTQTFIDLGVDQFGDAISHTRSATGWLSSDELIATVVPGTGDVTGIAAGSVTISIRDVTDTITGSVLLTVVPPDLTAPVITLLGTTPINVEYNSTYTDDGATALDDRDGDVTGSIVTVNPVDTSILGTYIVTYDVSDAAGNDATQVTRTVNVVDTTAPVVTLTGANPQTIEWGDGYTELGATADDGSTVVIDASAVNVGTLGSYLVTYNATDASSNSALEVTRTVNVVDTNAPTVVSVDSDGGVYNTLTVSPFIITVTFNENVLVSPDISVSGDPQAVDDCGDVDAKTFCFSYSVPPTQDTEKEIQIMNAEDATGNVMFPNSMHTFLVDTIIPVVTLTGANPQTIEWGDGYTELGATADDGSTVVIDSSAFVDAVSTYMITYSATDVSGNPAMTIMRTVEVVDTTIPTATVSYDVTTPTNGSVIATITPSEPVTGALTHTFTVNGTFTFDFTDPSGNAGSVDATVSNIDIVAPVITLLGTTPITVEYNSVYSDAGATALDDVDGVITGSIVTNNPVDTLVPGVYTVTYDVFDAVGNPAIQVTRSVTVSNPPSTGSRARRALPVFPVIPSANVNVAGGLFTFMRHLGLGLSGEDVTALQNRLMAEGVFSGPVTGYFGPLTLGAVQAYQRKMGISDTGFVGPLTLAMLNRGLALGNPSSNPLTAEQITERRTQLLGLLQQLLRLLQAQRDAQ